MFGHNRHKVLYVDVNSRYLNPSRQLLRHVLSLSYDVHSFGPGFSTQRELQEGLSSFIATHGPYHHVFSTPHIALNSSPHLSYDSDYPKIFYFDFPSSHLSYIYAIQQQLLDLDIPRSLFIIDLDLWNITGDTLSILDRFDFLFGPGVNLWPSHSLVNVKDIWNQSANDSWWHYIQSNKNRIVDFPHFVAPSEFIFPFNPPDTSRWSIPGIHYRSRQAFARLLLDVGIHPRTSSLYRFISRLRMLGVFSPRNAFLLDLISNRYRSIISQSTLSFACGSAIKMPLRKFFEIPAFGSILVCEAIPSLPYLGFYDGENCIILDDDPRLTIDRVLSLSSNTLSRIRSAGQDHVRLHHSSDSRSLQLRAII